MNIVLISTYDLGRQPFGLASPAGWLRQDGHSVLCVDLAISHLPSLEIRTAELVAFHLPMHTATRLAAGAIAKVRLLNPAAALCCYGLYAPLNAAYLRKLGVATILGGEFEGDLRRLASGFETVPAAVPERLQFKIPDRSGLPGFAQYPKLLANGERRRAGYTEASRGCKHFCRHCPVVPVYQGQFRVVQQDIVLADVRQQVAAGAQHISFGDPDFLNGPAHARRIVEALHREFPAITYDATIKIEHLLKHRDLLPVLRNTGCLFVITAVESVQDSTLEKLDKGHTRRDFVDAVQVCREIGLTLSPTFIPFTPWTTPDDYRDLLATLAELDLIENVAPVQLGLRLLIPAGSRLLELEEISRQVEDFDESALLYRWRHADPAMDELASRVLPLVNDGQRAKLSRRRIFEDIWELVNGVAPKEDFGLMPRATIPYMEEPWFC